MEVKLSAVGADIVRIKIRRFMNTTRNRPTPS